MGCFSIFDDGAIGMDTKLFVLLASIINEYQNGLDPDQLKKTTIDVLRLIRDEDGRGQTGLSDEWLLRRVGEIWANQVVLEEVQVDKVVVQPIVKKVLSEQIENGNHQEHDFESAVRRISRKFRKQTSTFGHRSFLKAHMKEVNAEFHRFLNAAHELGIKLDTNVCHKLLPEKLGASGSQKPDS